jgi:hypothetical protein
MSSVNIQVRPEPFSQLSLVSRLQHDCKIPTLLGSTCPRACMWCSHTAKSASFRHLFHVDCLVYGAVPPSNFSVMIFMLFGSLVVVCLPQILPPPARTKTRILRATIMSHPTQAMKGTHTEMYGSLGHKTWPAPRMTKFLPVPARPG